IALAIDAGGNLFVANYGFQGSGTTVSVFAPGSTTPSATLTGLAGPIALAVHAGGNLFVANANSNTVSVFALAFDAHDNLLPATTAPSATVHGLAGLIALAVDARGTLFVANANSNTVSVFALAFDAQGNLLPGSTAPSATLPGLNGPTALAF